MFTYAQLIDFSNNAKAGDILCTPDGKYALYKFDRGDKFEIRLEEKFTRGDSKTIGYMECILRIWLRKEDDLLDTLYRLLRNCLLVERITNERN